MVTVSDRDRVNGGLILWNFLLAERILAARAILFQIHQTLKPQTIVSFFQVPSSNRYHVFGEPDGQCSPAQNMVPKMHVGPSVLAPIYQLQLHT